MTYSSIDIIALLVLLIINYDVFRRDSANNIVPAHEPYRRFLYSVMLYYITDILWGILDSLRIMPLLYADTVIYFMAMPLSVLLWTRYVVSYLNENNWFSRSLRFAGNAVFAAETIALIVNFFVPVMFGFDDNGDYLPGIVRYILLCIQVLLFLTAAIYSLVLGAKTTSRNRLRYRMIGFFGVEMVMLISIQAYFPLLPLYSIGCMLGTCLLHTFVLEDEKAEYSHRLTEMFRRDQEQKEALGSARQMVYTDPLTGVKSKHAYIEAVNRIDSGITDGSINEFGVIVCDLNGLKLINDTLGHEAGDEYIKTGCMLICKKFTHSPVYRIGGDEFAVLLEGEDYSRRSELLIELDRQIEENLLSGEVVVSTGIDIYIPSCDSSFSSVFERADKKMYERKRFLKAIKAPN